MSKEQYFPVSEALRLIEPDFETFSCLCEPAAEALQNSHALLTDIQDRYNRFVEEHVHEYNKQMRPRQYRAQLPHIAVYDRRDESFLGSWINYEGIYGYQFMSKPFSLESVTGGLSWIHDQGLEEWFYRQTPSGSTVFAPNMLLVPHNWLFFKNYAESGGKFTVIGPNRTKEVFSNGERIHFEHFGK